MVGVTWWEPVNFLLPMWVTNMPQYWLRTGTEGLRSVIADLLKEGTDSYHVTFQFPGVS